MTPKQVKLLDTAVLKLMDVDLRKLIPDRQRDLQALQREAIWIKRELKARKGD
jgi:hypothetical protein